MPRRSHPPLARAVRSALARARDPTRAPAMQAYMKSAMPFRGVGAGPRRRLVNEVAKGEVPADARSFEQALRALWDDAEFREERYAAIDLLLARRFRTFLDRERLPLIEHMIETGAWWDYVDPLAANAIGVLLADEPPKMKRMLRAWAKGRNLWKRRSAILSQLRFGADTDLEFLEACIEPNLGDGEFFIQKAIGWALRQYAWFDPDETRRRVAAFGDRLSPLARREALKNLGSGATKKRRARK